MPSLFTYMFVKIKIFERLRFVQLRRLGILLFVSAIAPLRCQFCLYRSLPRLHQLLSAI